MKIALVSREFPPHPQAGGIATYTEKTARGLATAGHEVHVFTEMCPGADGYPGLAGVRLHRLPNPRVRPREARLLRRAIDVARAIRHEAPFDIVQACEWEGEASVYALSPAAPLLTRLATPRYLVNALNQASPAMRRRCVVQAGLERWQTRRSTRIVSPSQALADVVARDWRIAMDRIVVVPTGIEPPRVDPAAVLPARLTNRPYLLYFGRLEVRKGVGVWLDALPDVLGRHPNLTAVFAGEDLGVHGTSYQEYARTRHPSLWTRLVFLPRLPQQELFPLISGARLVVLPSRWESLANACLEAMALGRTVVATAGSGFDEVIEDGISGLLVPPDDPAALAAVVNHALADLARLRQLGQGALQRAAEYALDPMVHRLTEVYHDVLRARLAGTSGAEAA